MIDIRSPDKYKKNHIPKTINLPILNNIKKHKIEKLYSKNSFKKRIYKTQLITKNINQIIHDHITKKPKKYSPLIYY